MYERRAVGEPARGHGEAAEAWSGAFRALWEAAGDGILLADGRGAVRATNPAFADVFGLAPEAVVGRELVGLFVPADRGAAARCRDAALAGEAPEPFEGAVVDSSGTPCSVEARFAPVRTPAGATGLVAVLRDMTEPRRTEARLREETDTLETVNRIGRLLTAELDEARLVQALTDAAAALTGARFGAFLAHRPAEAGGRFVLSAVAGFGSEVPRGVPPHRPEAILGAGHAGAAAVVCDDVRIDPRFRGGPPGAGLPVGPLPLVSYLAAPVVARSGDVLGALVFGHPARAVFGARAERIVTGLAAQTAVALENARLYRRARDAVRARDEFLAVAAHELKTPVTSLRGYAQLVRRQVERAETLDPQRVRRAMAVIDEQSTRLTRLIGQLLDVARIEGGRLRIDREPADLAALLRRAVEAARLRTSRHRLTLQAPASLTAEFDSFRVEQVFVNLLDNAIRYSPHGGDIDICLVGTDGVARITVRDHGLGIPAGMRDALFDRFFQAHRDDNVSGIGLGLSISRQIVELHGGHISAEHPRDGGIRFVVELPLTRPVDADRDQPSGRPADGAPRPD